MCEEKVASLQDQRLVFLFQPTPRLLLVEFTNLDILIKNMYTTDLTTIRDPILRILLAVSTTTSNLFLPSFLHTSKKKQTSKCSVFLWSKQTEGTTTKHTNTFGETKYGAGKYVLNISIFTCHIA